MEPKSIAIIYHGGCPDGVVGAYAAWKKFGDKADYIPVRHGNPPPMHLDGKELYFVDFCYPKPAMDELARIAKSVTVLDHHEGIREVAEQYSGIFDANRSGASIAWGYFHPKVRIPKLVSYIEDGDLYKFALPNSRNILAYIYSSPFQVFEHLDVLARELEDEEELARIVNAGAFFEQHHEHIVEQRAQHAELVRFEGHECYLVGTTGEFASDVGHRLYELKPPFSIMLSADAKGLRVSLRGDGSVDLAAIAKKYGGNGHPGAAGFRIKYGNPVPWESIENDEDTRD